jgi:hypothetical protein
MKSSTTTGSNRQQQQQRLPGATNNTLTGRRSLEAEIHVHPKELEDHDESNADEFQGAGSNDKPVNSFLRAQHSTHSKDKEVSRTPSVRGGLDSEKHKDLGDLMNSKHSSDDNEYDQFGRAGKQDRPNDQYLRAQNPLHDIDFEFDDD